MTGPSGVPQADELEALEPTAVDFGRPSVPTPYAAARIAAFLDKHLC